MNWLNLTTMLRRSWWLPVLTTLVAVNLALVVAYQQTPMYEAQARFVVSPGAVLNDDMRDVVDSLSPLDNRTLSVTYAEILQSQRIYEDTLTALNLSAEDVEGYERSAVVLPETNVLVLSVTGPDRERVAELANAIGLNSVQYATTLYTVYDFHLLDAATPPDGPYAPTPITSAVLAAIVGIIIGGALMVGRELLIVVSSQPPVTKAEMVRS